MSTDADPDLASDALARAGELPPCYRLDRQTETIEQPPLLAYMNAETTPERDVAFLRLYAEKVLNRSENLWEIPNTRAATLRGIAHRFEAAYRHPSLEERIATLEARVRVAEAESLALLTRLSDALSPTKEHDD